MKVRPRPARKLVTRGALKAEVVFDAHGNLFVADLAGVVQCFSAVGRPVWQTQLAGGISATPTLHPNDAVLFVGTHHGSVCALEAATGAIHWQKEVPTKSDPRILSDVLFVPQIGWMVCSSWGGRWVALDAADGATRFSWDAGISPSAALAADAEGTLYGLRVVAGQGIQFVRITSDGQEAVLHREPETPRGARRTLVAAGPILDGEHGRAYFIANRDKDSRLCAWSLKEGHLLWRCELPACVQAAPALRPDGGIVVADLGGSVRIIGVDGAPRHQYPAGCEYLLAAPACDAAGMVYLGDPVGVIHLLDAAGRGRRLYETPRALQARFSFHPDGRLCVPGVDHAVYLFPAQTA